jgi:pyruvate dehydrogenase E1 component beta subunit
MEPKRRYWEAGEVDLDADPAPLWESQVRRAGKHATIVTYGPMVTTCLQAAEAARNDGLDLEVIDLRTLSPLDLGPVFESIRRTGHGIVVHEASRTLGVGTEVAARVTEECFYSLESPVQRVTGYDMPYPPSRVEDDFLPGIDRILDAVDTARAF